MDFKTYRRKWNEAANTTPKIPLNLDLELSAACNLRCPFCFIQSKDYAKKKAVPFMSAFLAKKILDEASEMGVPAVKVNWRGEPTLNPDFSEICAHAKKGGFHEVLINTNGNYAPTKIYGLMSCTKVMVSLDSFEPETYAKMRPGGDLGKVLDNIAMLTEFNHPNVWVRRVVNKDNKREDFAGEAKKRFGKKVKVAEHFVFDRVNIAENHYGRTYCGYPSQRIVFNTIGEAFPCCVDYHQQMPLGKYPIDSIESIWDGFKMKLLRETLKNGKCPPSACRSCTSWMAYKAPQREKVADKAL